MSHFQKTFITPSEYREIEASQLSGPNGWLLFVACNSGVELAKRVKYEYERRLKEKESEVTEVPLLWEDKENKPITKRFDDTETRPRLPEHVAGSNAFVFQSLTRFDDSYMTNDNFMQLLQMIRTLNVNGANRITAVTPYSAYARQDKPTFGKREATLAKLNADLMITSGVNDVITYHLHSDTVRGFYEPHRVVALTGLDLFLELFAHYKGRKDIVAVSTDAGGAKFTIHFAEALNIPYAIGTKYRPDDQKSDNIGIIGQLEEKKIALVVDDETVTGGSILTLIEALWKDYGIRRSFASISHNKIAAENREKLLEAHTKYGLEKIYVTDSIPQHRDILGLPFIEVHTLESRIACTINRMHYNQSVSQIFFNLR